MTKLMEWVSALVLFLSIWYCLITNKIETSFAKRHPDVLFYSPLIAVAVFGLYSVTVILYRVATFNDCHDASDELHQQIREARTDLRSLGFRFKEG